MTDLIISRLARRAALMVEITKFNRKQLRARKARKANGRITKG